jgi:lipoprotein-releasing system permease protein
VWKTGGMPDYHEEVQKVSRVEGVAGAGPAILGKALISSDRSDQFISIKGVDPAFEREVTDIQRSMLKGSLDALTDTTEEHPATILLGRDLAQQLGVRVGESVTLIAPSGTLSPMGMMTRPRRVQVAGIYSLGLYEFDAAYGFVSLQFAERLLGKGSAQLLELRVNDIYAAPEIAARVTNQLGSQYVAQDWADMNRPLFSALWLEKMAISITIGLIVMVAALNIIASLILLVMEKSRDIAILKTMGTSSKRVMTIFMLQGLIIGLVGTTVGAAAGYALCWVLDRYKLIQIPMDVYQVSHVPFKVQRLDFTVVIVSAVLICFVATLYPSRQASRLDPVQALRFE